MAKLQHWVQSIADRVETHHQRVKGGEDPIVCASGISPSGPVHLGNLRELLTVHYVADELRARGRTVEHIHSWDDYDRFRKVPEGMPASLEEYLGRPLADVPDPLGEYDSFATRHITAFTSALERLSIFPRYVRQAESYRSGHYNNLIRKALYERGVVNSILKDYRTLETSDIDDANYYPYHIYCESCGRDSTRILGIDEDSGQIEYQCDQCGYIGLVNPDQYGSVGKLAWKVDWPMRWFYERVDFEPGGEDHSAPGSSYTVAKRVVREVFNWIPPSYVEYKFVGIAGRSKMSSSSGEVITPGTALQIIEPAMLRWLYLRRKVSQPFSIEIGSNVIRTYDEWDRLTNRAREGKLSKVEEYAYSRSIQTYHGKVKRSALQIPFRVLSSAADITRGNEEQIARIVNAHVEEMVDVSKLRGQSQIRLECAIQWALNFQPEDERTHVRSTFNLEAYNKLSESQRNQIALFANQMADHWSLLGLSDLVYGVPKVVRGLPPDAPATRELKTSQRQFFIDLYRLLCSSDSGPRIPTLLLSVGLERARLLLTPTSPAGQS